MQHNFKSIKNDKKKISLGLLIVALSTSCVSKKIYNDLENKFRFKERNRTLAVKTQIFTSKNQLELDRDALTGAKQSEIRTTNGWLIMVL
jgi:chemotaxis protein MotB